MEEEPLTQDNMVRSRVERSFEAHCIHAQCMGGQSKVPCRRACHHPGRQAAGIALSAPGWPPWPDTRSPLPVNATHWHSDNTAHLLRLYPDT